ncbi:GDSL-type esterase/lipase family protein [Novosphingobium sp. G106]|uniref:GDSL-type esterase/lipase family protein n=1 Tax=Novosphingobium sp. G106 TaxID=2849500 RepID=UPI0035C7FB8E
MFWAGARSVDDRGFPKFEANLQALLKEIVRRSPQARIIVVTYPVIIPAEGNCGPLGLTDEQAVLMRAVGEKLTDVTRAAAKKADATLVDMARLSAAHSACSAAPWVNGFRPESGADFHPTLEGARATAREIANALRESRL